MTNANNEKGQNDAALAVLYARIARNAQDMGLPKEETAYLNKSKLAAIKAYAGIDKSDPLAHDLLQMAQHSDTHAAGALASHELSISDPIRQKVAEELHAGQETKRRQVMDAGKNHGDSYFNSHPGEKRDFASLIKEFNFYSVETVAIGGAGFTPQGNNRHNKPMITEEKVASLSGNALDDATALYARAGGTKAYHADAAPKQQIAAVQPQEAGKSASRNIPT